MFGGKLSTIEEIFSIDGGLSLDPMKGLFPEDDDDDDVAFPAEVVSFPDDDVAFSAKVVPFRDDDDVVFSTEVVLFPDDDVA